MVEIRISASVGKNARNGATDVVTVQTLLNHFMGIGRFRIPAALVTDGICGSKTKDAIAAFQFQNGLISQEHFENRIVPGGMTMQFMNQNMGKVPTPLLKKKQEENSNQDDAELSEILRDIDVNKMLRSEWDRKEFDTFIKLVLCELNGIKTDCTYMVFTAKNNRGQEARDYDQVAFISKKYDENVVVRLKHHFRIDSRSQLQYQTFRIYRALCNSIDQIKKWNNFNAALADADYSATEGGKYTREITRRMCRANPASIYYAVGSRMQLDDEKTGIFSRRLRYRFVLPTTVLLPGAIKGIY